MGIALRMDTFQKEIVSQHSVHVGMDGAGSRSVWIHSSLMKPTEPVIGEKMCQPATLQLQQIMSPQPPQQIMSPPHLPQRKQLQPQQQQQTKALQQFLQVLTVISCVKVYQTMNTSQMVAAIQNIACAMAILAMRKSAKHQTPYFVNPQVIAW